MHPQNRQPLNGPGPIKRFFSGLAEFTFHSQLGVTDPPLVDYVSDLLTRFVRNDAIYQVRDGKGRPLLQVTEMLLEAQNRVGNARRDAHRHIGDYTLFWSGLYPESLQQRQAAASMDHLIDYCEQGKRAYWIASTIETDEDEENASSEVLERLSCRFELCAYGLREIRREWESREDGSGPRPIFFN